MIKIIKHNIKLILKLKFYSQYNIKKSSYLVYIIKYFKNI